MVSMFMADAAMVLWAALTKMMRLEIALALAIATNLVLVLVLVAVLFFRRWWASRWQVPQEPNIVQVRGYDGQAGFRCMKEATVEY